MNMIRVNTVNYRNMAQKYIVNHSSFLFMATYYSKKCHSGRIRVKDEATREKCYNNLREKSNVID